MESEVRQQIEYLTLDHIAKEGVKMALTIDRPDYTAAQLNTTWTTIRNALSASMPSAIQTVTGQSNFSVIDIYDTVSSPGIDIFNKNDVLDTFLAVCNNRKAGFFSKQFVVGSSTVNDYYLIEVRNSISPGKSTQYKGANSFIPSSFGGQQRFRSSLTAAGSTYVNTIIAGDTSELPELLVRAKFYMSTNTITVEAYVQESGLSDYGSNIYGSPERFNDEGYNGFYPGTGGTYTYTAFLTFSGYAYWGAGAGTTLGSTESFDDGWPAGIAPPSGGGGTSGDHYTENLSSQITGSATTFTTTYAFVADSLKVYWNGQRQYSGTVTETSSNTFSTTFTPTGGDVLIVDYEVLST